MRFSENFVKEYQININLVLRLILSLSFLGVAFYFYDLQEKSFLLEQQAQVQAQVKAELDRLVFIVEQNEKKSNSLLIKQALGLSHLAVFFLSTFFLNLDYVKDNLNFVEISKGWSIDSLQKCLVYLKEADQAVQVFVEAFIKPSDINELHEKALLLPLESYSPNFLHQIKCLSVGFFLLSQGLSYYKKSVTTVVAHQLHTLLYKNDQTIVEEKNIAFFLDCLWFSLDASLCLGALLSTALPINPFVTGEALKLISAIKENLTILGRKFKTLEEILEVVDPKLPEKEILDRHIKVLNDLCKDFI